MIKSVICFVLLSACLICNAQKIKIEVKDSSNELKTPLLYVIDREDTVRLNTCRYFNTIADSSYEDGILLLEYKSTVFNLGKLDTLYKSIILNYNPLASDSCYTINKVNDDVLRTVFNYRLDCRELHDIYLYDTDGFKSIDTPAVKLRKRKE